MAFFKEQEHFLGYNATAFFKVQENSLRYNTAQWYFLKYRAFS
jgi:hypothetical protein